MQRTAIIKQLLNDLHNKGKFYNDLYANRYTCKSSMLDNLNRFAIPCYIQNGRNRMMDICMWSIGHEINKNYTHNDSI